MVWGFGATAGMASWFFILVTLLKTYQKTLKITSVVWLLNNLGSILIMVGIFSLFTIVWSIVFSLCSNHLFRQHGGEVPLLWESSFAEVLQVQEGVLLRKGVPGSRLAHSQEGVWQTV